MNKVNITLPGLVFINSDDVKEVKLKGIDVLYCDKPGRNSYVYPLEIVEEAVDYWNKAKDIDNSFKFIFARHPKDAFGDEEDYVYLAGVIDNLYLDKKTKTLKADVTLLKTVFGQLIKYLIDKGIKVGTSIRGKIYPEEKILESNINGKKVLRKIKVAKKLLLTGFDFVTFPSFIMTGASKEHYVTEKTSCISNLLEEFITSLNINDEDILCKLYGFCDLNINIKEKTKKTQNNIENNLDKEESKMGVLNEKDIELLELKKQNLELEITNLENKKKEYEEIIENLTKNAKEKSEELNRVRKEYEGLLISLANLKREYEEMKENVFEKARITEVEFKGKTYSLDNPPKIRIVKPSEKVDRRPWSEIDKNMIRKLIYLSQKARIAKEAFALVKEGWKEDWKNNLKYPHHVLVPSDDPNYDLDLVLSYDGLMAAYKYLMGARGAGYYLTPEERRTIAKHLLRHFRELKRADFDVEVPEQLKNIAESTVLLESEDPIIPAVFDRLIETGLIKLSSKKKAALDLDDDEIEYTKEKIDKETSEYILSKFAQAIFNTISEKTMSEDFMNFISKNYTAWKAEIEDKNEIYNKVMQMLWQLPNGEKSLFAQLLNIDSKDNAIQIISNIKNNLMSESIEDKLSAIEKLKSIAIVSTFDSIDVEEPEYNFDDIEFALYLVSENMNALMFAVENSEEFMTIAKSEATPTQSTAPEGQTSPTQPTNMPPTPPTGGETPTQPTPPTGGEEQPQTTLEKIQNEEDEEMYKEKLEKIMGIISDNIDLEEELTVDNVEDVIGKIITGFYKVMEENEELKEKVKEIEFKEYKERKKKELMKEGISATAIENAFEKAKNIDDIDIIAEVLVNEIKNITPDLKRKGKLTAEHNTKEIDKFDKIFNRI